ncbi:hypothetical protein [Nocardia wallacei]|uniref:hypothetical protein n=1 Tax=Nocardia wallacei TaxID=480035 RepID=UPI00245540F3|nr:hypothetical protein [Nocardia wallacei]
MMWRSKAFSRAAGGSRRGAYVAALLTALLLALPMTHCAEARGLAAGHHTHAAMSAETAGPVRDHAHTVAGGPLDGHCLLHFDHCRAEPVVRGTAGSVPAQHMVLLALAPAVLLVADSDDIVSAGPRDPPGRMPALGGRATLTRLCIARR